jgi:bacillithiol disulfide reductase
MKYDVIVIGGGPAGLSAAVEARKLDLSVLLVDKGSIVNSIQHFPTSMVFFSTVEVLEIGGVPFISTSSHPTRVEAVQYYSRVAKTHGIEFQSNSRVMSVRKTSNGSSHFQLEIKNETSSQFSFLDADKVIVATGFYDQPNMLNVPGENLPNVSHYFREPGLHFGQKVVVIGGKNSAVEAALDLYRHGVDVTLLYRKEWFGKSVKYWILPDIENRVKNGEIKTRFKCEVVEICPDKVIAEVDGKREEIGCDFVYALTGYHPDVNFLRDLGIEIDHKTGIPNHNPDSYETNIAGLYVAGSIVAGYDCNKIFIENGREHGKAIAKSLGPK